MNKDFIGKDAIEKKGIPRMRVGMRVDGRGIIVRNRTSTLGKRNRCNDVRNIPCLSQGCICHAYVETGAVEQGDIVEVDVRGRRVKAEIVPFPFYKAE